MNKDTCDRQNTGVENYTELLTNFPAPGGGGAHPALYKAGILGFRAGLDPEAIIADCVRCMPEGGRTVDISEVEQGVNAGFKQASGSPADNPPFEYTKPKVGRGVFSRLVKEGAGATVESIMAKSPVPLDFPEAEACVRTIQALYPRDTLLYLGGSRSPGVLGGNIRPAGEWVDVIGAGRVPIPPHIIVNPLTGAAAPLKSNANKMTLRGDGCVAKYEYAVVEFDGASIEDQLAFWSVAKMPVVAVVTSGGKSVHGWVRVGCGCKEQWDAEVRQELFGGYLVPLGVDGQCKNESRLSRLPGHVRAESGNIQKLIYLNPGAPEWTMQDFRAQMNEETALDGRAASSPINGAKGGRPAAPAPFLTAEEYIRDQLTVPEGYLVARHYRDSWYRFSDGWHTTSDTEMEKGLITYMHGRADLAPHATVHYARNVLHNMAAFTLCGIKETVEQPCWLSTGEDARQWVAFSNGIAVDTWSYASQLAAGVAPVGYSPCGVPDLFSADFVNYPWDTSQSPDMFLTYLNRVLPDPESRAAVQRMLGLLLCDATKYEIFWVVYGDAACGKTVLMDLIETLVGYRNVCRVGIEDLAAGVRFQTFPLATCKVNICGELATDTGRTSLAAAEAMFKKAVSGEKIEIERKGVDKYVARCRARFVLAGNSLPTWLDKSEAMWRRMKIIPFDVHIPLEERDADLARNIAREDAPALAAWALAGLADVIKDGYVKECPAGAAMSADHRARSDHERAFLEDSGYVAGVSTDKVTAYDLYREYDAWMCQNGYRALGSGNFAKRIEKLIPTARAGVARIEGSNTRVFSGVARSGEATTRVFAGIKVAG